MKKRQRAVRNNFFRKHYYKSLQSNEGILLQKICEFIISNSFVISCLTHINVLIASDNQFLQTRNVRESSFVSRRTPGIDHLRGKL